MAGKWVERRDFAGEKICLNPKYYEGSPHQGLSEARRGKKVTIKRF
jgi:hypothetical protein